MMKKSESNNATCRVENIGKFAVPICGHDTLTEFMVQDLKTRSNKGILFYGGLYANDAENRFFWYVSTLRLLNLEKIVSVADAGIEVSKYLGEISQGERMQILYRAFKSSFVPEPDDDVNTLIELDLLVLDESGKVKITTKGIELCNLFSHLVVNHRIKPPPEQLNRIFESFIRIGVWTPDSQLPSDMSLTVDRVMSILEEHDELEDLVRIGIDKQTLQNVIQLYLCPPF
jgi:hypothetical protein